MSGGGRRPSRPARGGRRPSSAAQRFQILVFAEGIRTEVGYINHWLRANRDRVIVRFAQNQGSSPITLVENAITQKKSDLREARKGRGDAFDEYWCVFDVDEHPRLPEALALAAANEIKVALSSPCLEAWFLIHFEPQTANISKDEAQHRAKEILKCDKVLSLTALALLDDRYEAAKVHAQALDNKHLGDGASQPWNPCTNMWELIETIRKAASLPDSGVPCSCWHLK